MKSNCFHIKLHFYDLFDDFMFIEELWSYLVFISTLMYKQFVDIRIHNEIPKVGTYLPYGHGYVMLTGVQVWNSAEISF